MINIASYHLDSIYKKSLMISNELSSAIKKLYKEFKYLLESVITQ